MMRASLREQFDTIDGLHRDLRAELAEATRRQILTIAERNHLARRLDRLRAARELIYRLMSEGGGLGLPLPAEGDLHGALLTVRRCIAGPDPLSTAFRDLVVQVDGSVTLGQVVERALAGRAA